MAALFVGLTWFSLDERLCFVAAGFRLEIMEVMVSGRYWVLRLLIVAQWATAGQAQPLPVEELSPHTPWNVHWSDDSCVLARGFGSAENPLVLKFERFFPDNGFQLVLTGNPLGKLLPKKSLAVTNGEYGPTHVVDRFTVGKSKDNAPALFVAHLWLSSGVEGGLVPGALARSSVTPEQEATIRRISFDLPSGKRLVLKTGSLGPAFASLRQCTDQLVQSWGFDPAQMARKKTGPIPKGNPATWATINDYPKDARSKGLSAIVNFRLLVDASGVPTHCKVPTSYTSGAFDKVTCANLMRRARFEPARDVDGVAVPWYFHGIIRYKSFS